ncbi:MAG: hypothetical protein FWC73_12300 [Defluviitaleaceae bacterium]|nr:hypothetical protein [Defluviitaleaceae bacterium]
MNRKSAKALCIENGIEIGGNYNMASRNKSARVYWANPRTTCLLEDWWLILYDDLNGEMHVFKVPANSISANDVKKRSDNHRSNHIRIEIRYNDNSFEDTESKIKFATWHIKSFYVGNQSYEVKPAVYPDDLPDSSQEYREGKKKTIAVNVHERNPAARQACISHYGAVCFICGFDFGNTYGDECEGLIHVHHINMISGAEDEYTINPINDLRPVCPNCHMVLHSRKNGYSIDDVKDMLDNSIA